MNLADSELRLLRGPYDAAPEDVLRIGAEVKRTHFAEGPLSIAAVNKAEQIVVLRREGRSEYINRMTGSVYAPAAHMVCRYWLEPVKGTNRHQLWCRSITEAPIKKGRKQ